MGCTGLALFDLGHPFADGRISLWVQRQVTLIKRLRFGRIAHLQVIQNAQVERWLCIAWVHHHGFFVSRARLGKLAQLTV